LLNQLGASLATRAELAPDHAITLHASPRTPNASVRSNWLTVDL
jgi:hypothetical protein